MASAPSLDQIITEIEQWFHDTMHNSVVSREVAVYNHVHSAYEELKGRIVTLATGKPAPAAQPISEEVPQAETAADQKSKTAATATE